jgi:hypothetical protein
LEKVGERLKLSETDDELRFGYEGGQRGAIAGETGVGELKGEQKFAGRPGFQASGGEAGHDPGQGALNGGGVVQGRKVETGRPRPSSGSSAWAASWMVVIAELLVAKGGRATAVAGRLNVLAGWTGGGHGGLTPTGLNAKGPTRTLGLYVSFILTTSILSGGAKLNCTRFLAENEQDRLLWGLTASLD